MSRPLRNAVWLAVGLVLLAGVVYQADPPKAVRALRDSLAHPWLLAGAVALFAATQAGFFVKWHLLSRLAGAAVTVRQSLRLFGTLYLVGTFTPGRAGELAVPAVMRAGGGMTGVALVNRLLESAWTVSAALLVAVLVFRGDPRSARLWLLGPVLLLFVGLMVVLSRRRLTVRLLDGVRWILKPLGRFRPVAWLLAQEEKYQGALEPFYAANERLIRLPAILLFCALMLAIWMMMVSANYLLVQATVPAVGKDVTFLVVFAVMVVSAAAMFVSPIPGGLGLTEFTAVAMFYAFGYPQDAFVPFLLLARFLLYVMVAVFYLVGRTAGRGLPEAFSS